MHDTTALFTRLATHARARNAENPGRRADQAHTIALDIARGCVDMRGFGAYTAAFRDLVFRTTQKLTAQSTLEEALAASIDADAEMWAQFHANKRQAAAEDWAKRTLPSILALHSPEYARYAPHAGKKGARRVPTHRDYRVLSYEAATGRCTYLLAHEPTPSTCTFPDEVALRLRSHLHQHAERTFSKPTERADFLAMIAAHPIRVPR